jgi:hypothetical protein
MGHNGYVRKLFPSKETVNKALKEQRGRYDETFELWNAKQLELEQKREEKAIAYRQNKKLNPDAKRAPNKTDFYDKF